MTQGVIYGMTTRLKWTRSQLLVAFSLYCRVPFGRLHRGNPEIIRNAHAIGRTPSALAMKLVNIASLDPAITSTGRSGLRAASANDRAMWEEMNSDWERFAVECEQALMAIESGAQPADAVIGDYDKLPVGEDRVVEATARVGQRFFRAAVLSAYNEQCCISGLAVPRLLVASHIVPWRYDAANRTNPRNGLLLSALHDKAFDSGVITIDDDMAVKVSRKYAVNGGEFFANAISRYDGRPISLPEKFAPDQEFLAYHRERIFNG